MHANKAALNAAFNAFDKWRVELVELTERRSSEVFDQLTDAAQTVGWPSEMVETSKEQLLEASKAQTEMMRHMVHGWRSNLKASSTRSIEPMTSTIGHALASPPVQLVKFAADMPRFWIQAVGTWQQNWSDAMGVWMRSEKTPHRNERIAAPPPIAPQISKRPSNRASAKTTVRSERVGSAGSAPSAVNSCCAAGLRPTP
jgi:hypothetical protein